MLNLTILTFKNKIHFSWQRLRLLRKPVILIGFSIMCIKSIIYIPITWKIDVASQDKNRSNVTCVQDNSQDQTIYRYTWRDIKNVSSKVEKLLKSGAIWQPMQKFSFDYIHSFVSFIRIPRNSMKIHEIEIENPCKCV